jgi:hypothetical protein
MDTLLLSSPPAAKASTMRRIVRSICATLAAAVAVTLGALAPASAAALPQRAHDFGPAYFVMTDVTGEHFVIKLITPGDIRHARDLVEGRTTDRPSVMGLISTRPARYNPEWGYHLRPGTISFFDLATEVCDATIPYVEEHLNQVGTDFLPGNRWCDWSSHLIAQLPAYDRPDHHRTWRQPAAPAAMPHRGLSVPHERDQPRTASRR